MRAFHTYESYAAWRKSTGGAATEPVRFVGAGTGIWVVNYDDAQAEIARLTAERDQALAKCDSLNEKLGAWMRRAGKAEARYAEAKDQAAAAAMEMREAASKICDGTAKYHISDPDGIEVVRMTSAEIRALPINPDAQKALNRLLAKAREDAIRDVEMPGSFICTWHKVTEWCEKEGETVSAQTAWGEVKQALAVLLNDGGRDE